MSNYVNQRLFALHRDEPLGRYLDIRGSSLADNIAGWGYADYTVGVL